MNQGSRSQVEKLQRRINGLVAIQETVQAALQDSCTPQARAMLEGKLHRHQLKEEQLRQELAALR